MGIHKLRMGIAALFLIFALALVPQMAFAEEQMAERIDISECEVTLKNVLNVNGMFDGDISKSLYYAANSEITLDCEKGFGSLYIIFDREFGEYTIIDNDSGEEATFGEFGILHEFVDLEGRFGSAPRSITICFNGAVPLVNEIFMFTSGKTPDFVQKWVVPQGEDEKADLLLMSTHADDDQLFFSGILPYYAGELGYEVQVAYFTNHRNLGNVRAHEALNGLWSVGVTRYPVFAKFGDYYSTNSLKNGYDLMHVMGVSDEAMMRYVVEQIRRFKPLVIVGHDLNGEYGHSMHMVYADLLVRASEITADESQYPDIAEEYGVWDVPKIYLHLLPENEIVMDWDRPLSKFNNMTAYEVTRDLGFPCHVSQISEYEWYFEDADKATEVKEYSPCNFGLFRSTAGPDVQKNDFFENLVTHKEQVRLAEEQAAREAEEARKAEEEAARLAAEEAAAKEEAKRLAEEKFEAEVRAHRRKSMVLPLFICFGVIALVGICKIAVTEHSRKK